MSDYPYKYMIAGEELWVSSTAPIQGGDFVQAFIAEDGHARSWKVKSVRHIRDVRGGDTELIAILNCEEAELPHP